MKKGKAAGIGVTVIVAAIVFGIASLPDEVLLETPIEASENVPTETFPIEFQPEIISSEEQTVEPETPEVAEPETPEVAEPETPEVAEPETPEESEGNIIEVKINDGVGASQR